MPDARGGGKSRASGNPNGHVSRKNIFPRRSPFLLGDLTCCAMRKALQILALFVAVVAVAGWLAGGRNPGWTRTSVTHREKDPVTEIEFPVTEKRFVPGVELLAVALVGAGFLWAASFLASRK